VTQITKTKPISKEEHDKLTEAKDNKLPVLVKTFDFDGTSREYKKFLELYNNACYKNCLVPRYEFWVNSDDKIKY